MNAKVKKEGELEFRITPCGIGTAIDVRHTITGAEKNITDYDSW